MNLHAAERQQLAAAACTAAEGAYAPYSKFRVGAAVLGTYTRGGIVVTAGSTDWAHGLRGKDPTVERITKNVLERLGQ